MYTQPKNVHQKLISFPDPIYQQAMAQVKKTGLSFSEYIRFLVLQHSSSFFISDEVEMLNKKDSLSVQEGIKDIKFGRYVSVKTPKELEDYLKTIKCINLIFRHISPKSTRNCQKIIKY